MADYRRHYPEILAETATVAAVSVDAPEQSEALRTRLSLPFPILCDTEHCVVKQWDVYNPHEKGGLAKLAVFIIDQDRIVRYASVDTVIKRVAGAQVVSLLQSPAPAPPLPRRFLVPLLSDWISAIRVMIRR